jgi:hypothetical protein
MGSYVIVEATYSWYWAADLLKEMSYRVQCLLDTYTQ